MRILLLSNGHGEDLSGALIGQQLAAQGAEVAAMPLVGLGNPYRQHGIRLIGATHEISTGGLGYTKRGGQLREIWEGQLSHLIRQLLALRRNRQAFDRVIAVGDVVPVLGAWLAGRPAAAYLVAYSSHYEGRLRLPWPCGWLLRRRCFSHLWARDALTAQDLTRQLHKTVTFLGNPFFDAVVSDAVTSTPAPPRQAANIHQILLLLPGSRLPEAERNLELLLKLLIQLHTLQSDPTQSLRLQAALVPALNQHLVDQVASRCGWSRSADSASLTYRSWVLELHWGSFTQLINQADLVISMAGTACEQAVGLALPVVQLAGEGPQFTAGFAEAQRRLLGPGVMCAEGAPGSEEALLNTARLCADQLRQLADPTCNIALQRRLEELAQERIGEAGGSRRMAQALLTSHAAP